MALHLKEFREHFSGPLTLLVEFGDPDLRRPQTQLTGALIRCSTPSSESIGFAAAPTHRKLPSYL